MTDKKYIPKPKDIRFLKAVNHVIAQNKKILGAVQNDSIVSVAVYGKRNVISKIRSHQRGVSQEQIEKFATHFEIDYNFFYRDKVPFNICQFEHTDRAKKQGTSSLVKFSGNNSGNIYNSRIYVCLEKAKQIMQSTPEKIRTDHQHLLDTIHQEIQKLESKLGNHLQKIERLEKEHSQMVLQLQNQLLEARKKETEVMEKYISICENMQKDRFEIRENGIKE